MFHPRLGFVLFGMTLVLALCRHPCAFGAQADTVSHRQAEPVGFHTAAVTVDGKALFQVRGISSFPAEERAKAIAGRVQAAAADPNVSPDAPADR